MTQEEALKWFTDVAKPQIENQHGLFCTFCSVFEDDHDPYQFTLEFDPYECGRTCGCEDCPSRTIHGNCYSEDLHINEDGTIGYDGERYEETRFNELLSNINL